MWSRNKQMTIDPHKDYYAILGVSANAEDFVVKAAYKALMQRYHPDRAPSHEGDYTGKVAEITEAYRILSNPEIRHQYDKLRTAGLHSRDGNSGSARRNQTNNQRPRKRPLRQSTERPSYRSRGSYYWALILGLAVLWKSTQTNIGYAPVYIAAWYLLGAIGAAVFWMLSGERRTQWTLSAWLNNASYGMIALFIAGFLLQQGANGLINMQGHQIAHQSSGSQSITMFQSAGPNIPTPKFSHDSDRSLTSTGMKPLNLDPNVNYLVQSAPQVKIPEWRKSLSAFGKETKALGAALVGLGAHVIGAGEPRDAALANYLRNMDEAQGGWRTPKGRAD
jgi:curved DNA-binding protein CbpA